jgi:hypothetical protein
MITKYYVDITGVYLGAFVDEGVEPPTGAIEVSSAPPHPRDRWDAVNKLWIDMSPAHHVDSAGIYLGKCPRSELPIDSTEVPRAPSNPVYLWGGSGEYLAPTTRFYVDANGNFLGGFAGSEPPADAVEVNGAPEDGRDKWKGSVWETPLPVAQQRAIERADHMYTRSDLYASPIRYAALSVPQQVELDQYRADLVGVPSDTLFQTDPAAITMPTAPAWMV